MTGIGYDVIGKSSICLESEVMRWESKGICLESDVIGKSETRHDKKRSSGEVDEI